MYLPRESEIRGALNRYCAYLNTQSSLLEEVRSMAKGIDLANDFGISLRTSELARQLMPVVEFSESNDPANSAWGVLLNYAWLWPDFVEQKPEFGKLLWLAIPRDWRDLGRAFQALIQAGKPDRLPDEALTSIQVVRNYQLVLSRPASGESQLQQVRSFNELSIRADEDLSRERLYLYQRLLRLLLVADLAVCNTPQALRMYVDEVWQDWFSHSESDQALLRPLYARSLRALIQRFEQTPTNVMAEEDWGLVMHQFCSFADQLGNRPERRLVDDIRQKVLTLVSKAGKLGKSGKWEEVRAFDLRLERGKKREVDQVLVIHQPLATKNRDAKAFERLTLPLPVHRVRPKQVQTARLRLNAEFPWLSELTRRICDEVEASLWLGEPFARFAPILLVSRPGIGKTRYARRLSQLLGTPLNHVVMNGMKSSMQLKGASAGWGDSRPSVFIEQMLWLESANYLVLLDEIDKCSTSEYNGNPLDVLLSMLERENAANFADECLGVKVDLSRLSFIATANDIRRLPGPLLSRFRVIKVDPPTRSQLSSVVLGARDDRARELGIDARMLPLMADEVDVLAQAGRSPREVVRLTHDYLMRRELDTARSPAARH